MNSKFNLQEINCFSAKKALLIVVVGSEIAQRWDL